VIFGSTGSVSLGSWAIEGVDVSGWIVFFVPILWLAIALDMMHVWFAAMALPAFAILVLEQIPKYRGTLFFLNSLFNNVGKVLAPSIGGALLVFSSGIMARWGCFGRNDDYWMRHHFNLSEKLRAKLIFPRKKHVICLCIRQ
jgi:MFS family permease